MDEKSCVGVSLSFSLEILPLDLRSFNSRSLAGREVWRWSFALVWTWNLALGSFVRLSPVTNWTRSLASEFRSFLDVKIWTNNSNPASLPLSLSSYCVSLCTSLCYSARCTDCSSRCSSRGVVISLLAATTGCGCVRLFLALSCKCFLLYRAFFWYRFFWLFWCFSLVASHLLICFDRLFPGVAFKQICIWLTYRVSLRLFIFGYFVCSFCARFFAFPYLFFPLSGVLQSSAARELCSQVSSFLFDFSFFPCRRESSRALTWHRSICCFVPYIAICCAKSAPEGPS